MNTSLKVQSYLKGLILFTVLLTNQAMGQSNVKKSFNEYMGTWSGFAKQSLEQMQKTERNSSDMEGSQDRRA